MTGEVAQSYAVIVSGIGGMGALTAGRLVAEAGISRFRQVLWYPNITTAMRNAPADCTVILSDEEIASPLVFQADAVLVLEPSLLKTFEPRVRPGGLLIVESSGLRDEVQRDDVRVVKVPAMETASRLGSMHAANLVMLGAYIEVAGALPAEVVEEELARRFAGNETLLSLNQRAFREGVKLASGS